MTKQITCGHDTLAYYAKGMCRPCYERERYIRVGDPSRKERVKRYKYKHLYGVSLEDAQKIIDQQGGVCAICLVNPATDLDHDHQTGAMRAFLCRTCNWAIGHLQDDPDIIDRAAAYVRKHHDKRISM